MEIVKENKDISTEKVEFTQDQYYAALVEDFKAGEITFEKVEEKLIVAKRIESPEFFEDEAEEVKELQWTIKPEAGQAMYWIEYVKNDMYLRRCSFQFSTDYEAELISKDKLVKYLLYMLSVQMSKLI